MSGRWAHPLDPPAGTPGPPALAPHAVPDRRVLLCRACGQSTGVPGAVLCAGCWPTVPPERRAALGKGHPLVDPTTPPGFTWADEIDSDGNVWLVRDGAVVVARIYRDRPGSPWRVSTHPALPDVVDEFDFAGEAYDAVTTVARSVGSTEGEF